MADWESKFAFGPGKFETHTVDGKTFHFYAVSVGVLLALKDFAKPLSKALNTLFSDNKNDYGTTDRQLSRGEDRELVILPATEAVLRFRSEQRDKAITEFWDSLGDPKLLSAVGDLILDSLRELFPPGETKPPSQEFMRRFDVVKQIGFLTGVAKANKGMFGPLADRASELWKNAEAALKAKMALSLASENESPESPTARKAEVAGTTTPDGETSRTTSSSSLNEDTAKELSSV